MCSIIRPPLKEVRARFPDPDMYFECACSSQVKWGIWDLTNHWDKGHFDERVSPEKFEKLIDYISMYKKANECNLKMTNDLNQYQYHHGYQMALEDILNAVQVIEHGSGKPKSEIV